VIVLQLIDLLQKSELEKVYFCACGMSFCKTLQKQKMQKKVFWQFIFGCLSQKLMPWVHLLTFLSSDFFSEPEIWSSITN